MTALPTSTFWGRSADLRRIEELFDAGARVVTLWGPPGIGKTRLAREHERSCVVRGEPVVTCELQEAGCLDDVLDSVARALQMPRTGDGAAGVESIGRALAARGRSTVVLDNFEQIVHLATDTLEPWLVQAPETRWLVTSRALLKIPAERPHEVEPLAEEGVDLFIDRALSAGARPAVLAEQRAHVESVVRRLEGIPLAIELAAARCVLLAPSEIDRALDGSASGAPHARALPQVLRQALDASWALLSEPERTALAQLSVFRGGFTLEAALAVVDLGPDAPASAEDVLRSLREKSLVRSSTAGPGRPWARYGLFVPVQEYAEEKLEELGLARATTRRHAAQLIETCEALSAVLLTTDDYEPLDRLADELDNLMAVFRTAQRGATDGDVALRVARILVSLLNVQGMRATAAMVLRTVLSAAPSPDGEDEVWCRTELGDALVSSSRVDEGTAELERALASACRLDRPDLEARARVALGTALAVRGAEEQAESELVEAARLAQVASDAATKLLASLKLWNFRCFQSQMVEARDWHDTIEEPRGWWMRARWMSVRSGYLVAERRCAEAIESGHEAMALARRGGAWVTVALSSADVAWAHQELGELDEAEKWQRDAIGALSRIGAAGFAAALGIHLASIQIEKGDLEAARRTCRASLDTLRGPGAGFEEVVGWAMLGGLSARLDLVAAAEEAFAEASRLVLLHMNATTAVVIQIEQGHLDLARARRARAERDEPAALRFEAQARRRLARWQGKSPADVRDGRLATREVRASLRILKAALERVSLAPSPPASADEPALRIDAAARWTQRFGEKRVEFPKGHALRAILMRLARQRVDAPGDPVTPKALAAAAWPGARPDAATANRLRVSLHRLRKAVGPIVVRRGEGWLLDPTLPFVIEGES